MNTDKIMKNIDKGIANGKKRVAAKSKLNDPVMRRSMVFIGEDGNFKPKDEQRLCGDLDCRSTFDEPITRYPSRQHAIDAGWRYVERGPFCNKSNYRVWVCPTCAKKIGA